MHDFDFLVGKDWRIKNRILKERLVGCEEWTESEAQLTDVRKILGGMGNIDRYVGSQGGQDFEAISVRVFNPNSHEWTIYWGDTLSYRVTEQVVGRFEAGVGDFFGTETHKGKNYRMRFRWCDIAEHSARWEQAYFDERSGTWETNWIMEFTEILDEA